MLHIEELGVIAYIERMNFEKDRNIEVYLLTNKKAELLTRKPDMMELIKKIIPMPLAKAKLPEIAVD